MKFHLSRCTSSRSYRNPQHELNAIQIDENDKLASDLMIKYPSVFQNKIGKLKNHLFKLHIDRNVKQVRQKRRPTPIHLRTGIEKGHQSNDCRRYH